jgi:hypothetical protein
VEVQDLMAGHADSLEPIVNCDETARRSIPNGLLTWTPVGADGVTVRLDGKEKESVTVLASVIAGSDELPLFAIAKEKTRRAEKNQLGSDETLLRDHSPPGGVQLRQPGASWIDWLDIMRDASLLSIH